jgi:hypothetical protein
MNHLRFALLGALGSLTTGALLAAGCGSSSNNKPIAEAGVGEDTSTDTTTDAGPEPDAGSQGPTCSPVSGTSCPSQQGLTCCIDLTNIGSLLSGAPCVPAAQCTAAVQYECLKTSDCAAHQVCCASMGGDGGLPEAGLGDAGILGALPGAGAGGLGSLLGGFQINVSCQPSCGGGQQQLCAASSECSVPSDTCQAVSLPGLPGGGGEGGISGLLSMVPGGGANAIMPMACSPPDAGAPPVDSGSVHDAAFGLDANDAAPNLDANDAQTDAPTGG